MGKTEGDVVIAAKEAVVSSEPLKECDRPFKIMGVLDGEGFHSGYMLKADADTRVEELNKMAVTLGLKTRYIVK